LLLQPLRPGDIVDIVAPASRCTTKEFNDGVRAIKKLGLKPRYAKNIFAKSVLFSNSDEERLDQLKRAVYAPDSKMIWCLRGGYGSLRLLPSMHQWPTPKKKKIFLGYSDITSLHNFLGQEWKWPTLHGQMVERFGGVKIGEKERKNLIDILFGHKSRVEFHKLKPLNAAARKIDRVLGPVTGGNAAVLQSHLGTPSSWRPHKGILFLEDIGERPHRVDRMLEQFRQAGWFDRTDAVVFGYFMLSDARDRRDLWNDVMPRFAKTMTIPVLSGLPVGHNWELQTPMPFRTHAELETGPKASLIVSTGIAPA
jgi:muramoyltetrapeptide carboxypeptidase